MNRRGRRCLTTAVLLGAAAAGPIAAVSAAQASAGTPAATIAAGDWPQFLHDPGHTSTNTSARAITPSNVGSLRTAWSWTPPSVSGRPVPTLEASPTVAGGLVYVGTRSGWLYALNQATGKQVWAADTGYLVTPCFNTPSRGITATPAVAADPRTGRLVVYEAGADATGSAGNITLYAFDATTGSKLWSKLVSNATNAYAWASPVVAGGRVYVGVAAACDNTLVPGAIVGFNGSTGAVVGRYQVHAPGVPGGSVWTTPASDGTDLWATTGNGEAQAPAGDEESMIRVSGTTLAREDGWQVPNSRADQDFAASPTLFRATLGGVRTLLVGACSKNGVFYAFDRSHLSAGPVWQQAVATSSDAACDPAAVWDAARSRLDLGTAKVTVGGKTYRGSIVQLDPASGHIIWRTQMPGMVVGSPTLNGGGVLAAGTWTSYTDMRHPADVVLLNATTGKVLRQIATIGPVFAQPVFAGNRLLIASTAKLTVYVPKP